MPQNKESNNAPLYFLLFLIIGLLAGIYATNNFTIIQGTNNGAMDVFIQDQTTPPLDLFFVQATSIPTSLAVASSIGDRSLTVLNINTCSVGDYLGVFNTENSRSFFATISGITGNVIDIDTPVDFGFFVNDTVGCFTRDLSVDGSVSPEIFAVQVGSGSSESLDITRILLHILDSTSMDDAKFGGIAGGLTNGIVLRRVDGDTRNIWNIKTNGEFGELAYDKTYDDKAPAGFYGVTVRYTLGGQDKHGVVIRLDPGDALQLIVQDDLTGLDQFRIVAQGHIVD